MQSAPSTVWEVVGALSFNGRVDLLVFVERKTFWQVAVEIFEPSRSFARRWSVMRLVRLARSDRDRSAPPAAPTVRDFRARELLEAKVVR
jgi:hypothetical protein